MPSELYPAPLPAQRKPQLVQQPDLIGTSTLVLAANSPFTKIDGKQAPIDSDVYLTDFGNSIDNQANANFVTFQIRVNGSPFKSPWDQIKSQIGPANAPRHFYFPIKLASGGALIEIWGAVAAGAAGNTALSAQLGLLYTAPGVPPAGV